MSITQLSPPLPVDVAGKGKGMAFAVIDSGPEHDLLWVSAIDATGEICRAESPQVKMRLNEGPGRGSATGDLRAAPMTGRANSRLFRDDSGDPSWSHAHAIHIPDADVEYSAYP